MTAFNGDTATRDRIVFGLRHAIASQAFLPDADADMPTRVDLISAIVGKPDINLFERETGYLGALGLLANQSVQMIAGYRRADARRLAVDWFAAVAPGTDLLPVAASFAVWLLDEAMSQVKPWPELVAMVRAVQHLHHRFASGDHPERAAWRVARTAALELADGKTDPDNREVAELAAGLAWPVDRSQAMLAENTRLLCGMKARHVVETSGWRSADRDACSVRMQEIWRDLATRMGREPLPNEFRRHFEQCHAELAVPFSNALNIENTAFSDATLTCASRALEMMVQPTGTAAAAATPRQRW